MSKINWRIYGDAAHMANAVAQDIRLLIEQALAARGEALIVLPGGKSPIPIFERLAAADISWRQVTILPTDDRLVAPTDPLSNLAMIDHHFGPTGASVVPMAAEGEGGYHAAGKAADGRLADLRWPPDLVWLGIGTDGHTASIFPGPDLAEALDGGQRVLGVMPDPLPPEAPVPRVTLSRRAILSGRRLMLALTGDEKRRVVTRALEGQSPPPIGHVLSAATAPVDIYWSA